MSESPDNNWLAPRYPAEVVHLRGRLALLRAENEDLREKRQEDIEDLLRLRGEVERLRSGWDTDVDWANKLLMERDEARAEVERLREALRWIAMYGQHDGDLLDGHEQAMRHIADNALR